MAEPQKLGTIMLQQRQKSSATQNLLPTSRKSSAVIERYGNSKNFLAVFNPDMQYKYCTDVERCYTGTAPTLSVVRQAYGDTVAESWLEIQLKDLSEFAGCKEKLSVRQIEQTAKVIMLNFHFLKVTEMMHFFILFKGGKFGKFYGAVDGLVITEALQDYLKLRREALEFYRRKQEEKERAANEAEHARNAMTYEEYKELEWLFNMGYEPWRIKAELEEQRRQEREKQTI